jgi:DNA polymerase III alpha subunit
MNTSALIFRSFYSLLRSAVSVERFVKRAREFGYHSAAIADVNAMYGVVDFVNAAQQVGLNPLVGVEILTKNYSTVLLAQNRKGYKNLCRITTSRNLNPQFDIAQELQKNAEGVICISTDALLYKRLLPICGENLFSGCQNAHQAAQLSASNPVAFDRFNILDDDDVIRFRVLNKVRQLAGTSSELPAGAINKLVTADEFTRRFKNHPQPLIANELIANSSDFNLIDNKLHLPKAKLPKGKNADRHLSKLCLLALARKYDLVDKQKIARLQMELTTIKNNLFSDYFLVVKQIVDFAKAHDIPVDVRGSAAGSFVSYLLGFTRVCPIENNLYFERFMNPGRQDCPDIDIDLCWRRRDEVINFCYENWGNQHVAMVCTINRYRRRSAIRDVARALNFPPDQINDLVNKNSPQTSAVHRIAEMLTGIPRHIGIHCGGIIITPEPVNLLSPLQRASKGIVVTQYDKNAAEALGLIKIDLLSNRSLSTVHDAVNSIHSAGLKLDINNIDPEDPKTAQMLSKGKSIGVFQCESPAMRQLLSALKIRNKKDIAIALSLIRPGPAAGGMKTEYIERHLKKKKITYRHPKIEKVLADTYGVMLYQEDVMAMAVEVAGYTVAEADRFRSEVSKKVSSAKLQKQYADFVYHRAPAAGIDRSTAHMIWDDILRFASYSYCKAHAAVYANIAWQTAWLKAHYPIQFYCALFNNHHGMYPLSVYVWDAIRTGIKISPPHVNKSDYQWSCDLKSITAGLKIVKALTSRTIDQIITQRLQNKFISFSDFRRRVKATRSELANLVRIGACDGLANSRGEMMLQLYYKPVEVGQQVLFELIPSVSTKILPDYDIYERLKAEINVTGIGFSAHPSRFIKSRYIPAKTLNNYIGRWVTIAGIVVTARTALSSQGKKIGFVTIEDDTGLAEVSFFADNIDQYRKIVSIPGPVWITGKVTEHLSSVSLQGKGCGRAA